MLPFQSIADQSTIENNLTVHQLQLKQKDKHHIAALVQSSTAASYCYVSLLCFCISVTTLKQTHQQYALLQQGFLQTQAMLLNHCCCLSIGNLCTS